MGTYLQDCLDRRLILFTGKGGVGKSAVAWATALLLQQAGKKVLFCSWDPFENKDHKPFFQIPGIETLSLEALECFKEYVLQVLKFERIYDAIFANKVLRTFVQAAPGLSETVVAGKIWQLFDQGSQDTLIVDLPASGHAFSFFQSPLGVKKLFGLGFVHKETGKIAEMFQHPQTRLDFVAIPEEMSLTETQEFHAKLKELHPFTFGYLHVNQCTPNFECPEEDLIKTLPKEAVQVMERFQIQRNREQEALETVVNFPLRRFSIPKYGTESAVTTIERIAEVLGRS